MFKINSSVISYIGSVRKTNEDNFYMNGRNKTDSTTMELYFDEQQRDSYLYAVCDGMGGEHLGDLASLIAVETLKQYQTTDIQQTLGDYIQNTNKIICNEIKKNNVRIGTTLALLYICDNKAISYNIGDSRVYHIRHKKLTQISEDHTEAQQLVKMGIINKEDACSHKTKNKLTQHLGIFPNEFIIEPFISSEIEIIKNDVFLLCSDGFVDIISDIDIPEILSVYENNFVVLTEKLTVILQNTILKDNATVVIVKVC